MTKEDGQNMTASLRYFRDVYLNCFRMITSADIYLSEQKLYPIPGWGAFERPANSHKEFDNWFIDYIVRQYSNGKPDKPIDLLTVAAVPWRRDKDCPKDFEPMCIVSRCIAKEEPDDIYWIGAAQAWQYPQRIDGKIRKFKKQADWTQDDCQTFDRVVDGSEIITCALPLLEITSSDKLEESLLKPILNYQPWPFSKK